jgi:hypothetical protein
VFVSIYVKEDAELVLQSRAFGEFSYLTPGEIDQTSAMLRGQFAQQRTWGYRLACAGFRGLEGRRSHLKCRSGAQVGKRCRAGA